MNSAFVVRLFSYGPRVISHFSPNVKTKKCTETHQRSTSRTTGGSLCMGNSQQLVADLCFNFQEIQTHFILGLFCDRTKYFVSQISPSSNHLFNTTCFSYCSVSSSNPHEHVWGSTEDFCQVFLSPFLISFDKQRLELQLCVSKTSSGI